MITTSPDPLAVLEKRGIYFIKRGSSWSAPCPLHADRSPSLHLFRGRNGVVRVACCPCGFTDTLPAFLCRLDGHPPLRAFYRAALVECGLPTRDPRPVVTGPPPPTHWPDGQPLPDERGIRAALVDVGTVDIEAMSPAPPFMGEPDAYPPDCWIFAPRFLRCHPKPANLTLAQQAALVARVAAMDESPRLHSVLLVPGRLLAVWERTDPPFVRLCHRLGHDPSASTEGPARTIFSHE
jgi:hypothetical protein